MKTMILSELAVFVFTGMLPVTDIQAAEIFAEDVFTEKRPGTTGAAADAGTEIEAVPNAISIPQKTADWKAPSVPQIRTARAEPDEDGRIRITVAWEAGGGGVFQVLRRNGGEPYQVAGNVRTDTASGTFTDENVQSGRNYSYTVRRILKSENGIIYGPYDESGVSVTTVLPKLEVSYTNLRARLTWVRVPGAVSYRIYRKNGTDGSYRLQKEKKPKREKASYSFKDVYSGSVSDKQKKDLLEKEVYLDPPANPFHYTVKAVSETRTADGRVKTGYGIYSSTGVFHLETPVIVSVSRKKIKIRKKDSVSAETNTDGKKVLRIRETVRWGTVANAEAYRIYSGHLENGRIVWKLRKEIKAKDKETQKTRLKVRKKETYVTVRAIAGRDQTVAESGYDTGFTTANRKYQDKKVLFIGDSITYGSPYREPEQQHIYSYARRVAQLTGVSYYNPSISGATLAYDWPRFTGEKVYSLFENVVLPISRGGYAWMPSYLGNTYDRDSFYHYDYVILECGTNDYTWNVETGSTSSADVHTYGGALNETLRLIQAASNARVRDGKKPIRVVMLDLFYSDRVGEKLKKKRSRFTHENKIGYTLKDYQKVLDQTVKVWKKKGLKVYQFETKPYVNKKNAGHATADNLHMTKYTASQLGNGLSEYLIRNVFQ